MRPIAMRTVLHLWRDDEAASMVEYALLLAAITVGVFGAIAAFSGQVSQFFTTTSSTLGSIN